MLLLKGRLTITEKEETDEEACFNELGDLLGEYVDLFNYGVCRGRGDQDRNGLLQDRPVGQPWLGKLARGGTGPYRPK